MWTSSWSHPSNVDQGLSSSPSVAAGKRRNADAKLDGNKEERRFLLHANDLISLPIKRCEKLPIMGSLKHNPANIGRGSQCMSSEQAMLRISFDKPTLNCMGFRLNQ
jgi:hypothetical protein